MQDKIKQLISELDSYTATNKEQLEAFRLKYLSKKGVLTELFGEMKNLPADQRKDFGLLVNDLKTKAEEKFQLALSALEALTDNNSGSDIDLTLPAEPYALGSRHPISITRNRILSIFGRIGFTVAYGPEIEDDWHNFTALNFPENHPARDMQDTFFIDQKEGTDSIALRTHTSSIQVRVMETTKPPIRILAPGRVYRNEAISARAHCFFHQVEGLYLSLIHI